MASRRHEAVKPAIVHLSGLVLLPLGKQVIEVRTPVPPVDKNSSRTGAGRPQRPLYTNSNRRQR